MTTTVPRRGQATKRKADPRRTTGGTITPEAKQRIIDAYVAGVGINGIAATFGHARTTVRKVLRNSDLQLRDDVAKPKISREELTQRHAEGWTARQIADSCGAHIATVHQRLADLGLQAARSTPSLPVAKILAARAAGQSLRSLAEEYGVHRETIARRLASAGVTPGKPAPVVSVLKLTDMCRRGMTVKQMSLATGIGVKTLNKHLAAAGMRAADKRPGRERPAVVPPDVRGPRV